MLCRIYLLLVFTILVIPQTVISKDHGGIAALANLSELKIYFDVKADSAGKVEKRMQWILDTYEQAKQQGLQTSFIIGFRSQASFFVTKGDDYIDDSEIVKKEKIEKWLLRFRKMGIIQEQCGLSAELFEIDEEDFLPEVSVVKNSFVSIAGYQNKGYAYVPM